MSSTKKRSSFTKKPSSPAKNSTLASKRQRRNIKLTERYLSHFDYDDKYSRSKYLSPLLIKKRKYTTEKGSIEDLTINTDVKVAQREMILQTIIDARIKTIILIDTPDCAGGKYLRQNYYTGEIICINMNGFEVGIPSDIQTFKGQASAFMFSAYQNFAFWADFNGTFHLDGKLNANWRSVVRAMKSPGLQHIFVNYSHRYMGMSRGYYEGMLDGVANSYNFVRDGAEYAHLTSAPYNRQMNFAVFRRHSLFNLPLFTTGNSIIKF